MGELFYGLIKTNASDYTTLLIIRGKGFSYCKSFDNLLKKKKERKNGVSWVFQEPLDKLTNEKKKLPNNVKQLLASRNTVRDRSELNVKLTSSRCV